MTFLHCNPAFRHDDLGAQHQHGSTGGSLISAYSKIQFYKCFIHKMRNYAKDANVGTLQPLVKSGDSHGFTTTLESCQIAIFFRAPGHCKNPCQSHSSSNSLLKFEPICHHHNLKWDLTLKTDYKSI